MRLACLTCATPLLALAFLNLWINSESGRSFLQTKITQKVGFKARIKEAGWTPWGGLKLRRVEIFTPNGSIKLTNVESIEASFDLISLTKGDTKVKHVVLESPVIEFTTNELFNLFHDEQSVTADRSQTNELAKNRESDKKFSDKTNRSKPLNPPIGKQPKEEQNSAEVEKKSPQDQPSLSRASEQDLEKTARKQKSDLAKPAEQPNRLPKVDLKMGHFFKQLGKVQCNNAKIVLKGSSDQDRIVIEECNIKMPNKGADGHVTIGSIQILGEEWLNNARFRIQGSGDTMRLSTESCEVGGSKISLDGEMASSGKFKLNVSNTAYSYHNEGKVGQWGVTDLTFNGSLAGYIFTPKSWFGGYETQAKDLYLDHPSKQLFFDTFSSKGELAQLNIKMREFLLNSDVVKIIGLGKMNKIGVMLSQFKVIATPEEAENMFRFAGGIRMQLPFETYPEAPNFKSCMIEVGGNFWNPKCKTHHKWVPIKELLLSARNFLEVEKVEEEQE